MQITSARYKSFELQGSTLLVTLELTMADASTVQQKFATSNSWTSTQQISDDLAGQIDQLNKNDQRRTVLLGVAVNTAIPIVPPAPAAPTARQQAVLNARTLTRYKMLKDAGVVIDTTALAASVNAALTANPTWLADL